MLHLCTTRQWQAVRLPRKARKLWDQCRPQDTHAAKIVGGLNTPTHCDFFYGRCLLRVRLEICLAPVARDDAKSA